MTDNSEAVRNLLGRGSVYSLALAVQLSAGLLVLPLLTRLLDPAEFGVVAVAAVVRQLLAIVVALGIPAAIARFAFDKPDGLSQARALIVVVLGFVVVGTGLAELTGSLWASLFSQVPYGGALRIATWTAVPMVAVLSTQALLRSENRVGWFVTLSLVSSVFAQLLGIAAVVLVEATAAAYLGGVGVGFAVAAILGFVVYPPHIGRTVDKELIRRALVYGLPTVSHALALHVLIAGDRVVVERLEGLEALSRYHVAYLIGGIAMALVGAVNNAWSPIVLGATEDRRWPALASTATAMARTVMVLVGGIALLSPIALVIAAPASYDVADLVPLVAVIAAAAVPLTWYLANAQVLFQVGRTGVLAVITPVTAVVNIGLNYLLVPSMGLMGAGVATVLSYTLQSVLVQAGVRKMAEVPWEWARLGSAAVGAGVLAFGGAVLPVDGLWLAMRVAAAAILFGAFVFVMRSRHSVPLESNG